MSDVRLETCADLRSKFGFYIRGLLNVETCAVDYRCLSMQSKY